MQGQAGDHEVKGAFTEGQPFLVGGDGQAAGMDGHARREVSRDHERDAARGEARCDHTAAAEVERAGETVRGVVEAVEQTVGGLGQDGFDALHGRGRAVAPAADQGAVEDLGGVAHAR